MTRPLLFALQFLTRIPVAPRGAPSGDDLRRATGLYSVVGLLVGGAAAAVYRGSISVLPASVSVVLALLFSVIVTGALHEDGLADCADGFAGSRERARALEIMRDSRIGTFGALAIAFALLLKYTLLSALGERDVIRSLIVAGALSRWLVLPMAYLLPSARRDGLGSAFASYVGPWQILIGAVPVMLFGAFFYGLRFIAISSCAIAAAGLFGWYCHRRIGGITGDCLGAAVQLAEIASYTMVVVLEPWP
jgi:adenosylcobinamide-GDP ribazoletransferase